MNDETTHLCDPLPGIERVTVWGAGWTGVCAANFLRHFHKTVTLTDTRDRAALQASLDARATSGGTQLADGVVVECGKHEPYGAQAIVLTQSVKPSDPEVAAARAQGLPIIPEVELVSRALSESSSIELLVIGGTDGKTTTTKLVVHLLAEAGRRVVVGGNSWLPLSGAVLELEQQLNNTPLASQAPPAVLVGEISAFQLPPWHGFKPGVAAVTNIAEDHVQEYFQGSMEAYIAAKRAVTDRLDGGGVAVLNVDDPVVRSWEDGLRARGVRVVRTSLASRAVNDHPDAVFRSNGELRVRRNGAEHVVAHQRAVPLLGDHNIENVLTALGTLLTMELEPRVLAKAFATFTAPHHRLEHVASWNGIDIYDDSKATNTHAATVGLSAFATLGDRPLIAVVGGVDKGLALDSWVEALSTRTQRIIVIGELRTRLLTDFGGKLPGAIAAASLEEAVATALTEAEPGYIVVLSPACSSFDMFSSYADRGRQFKALVHQHIAKESP